jgi:hypothetical protein
MSDKKINKLHTSKDVGLNRQIDEIVENQVTIADVVAEPEVAAAIAVTGDAHTHANKSLLDTYAQTESALASAVTDDHTHTNKALLDTYDQTNANLTTAVSQTHSNTYDPTSAEHDTLIGGSAATSATTGTMTVTMDTAIKTITPTGNCVFNASGGTLGQIVTFWVTTSGTVSYTLTFNTNMRAKYVYSTGITSGVHLALTFRYVATNIWASIDSDAYYLAA